MPGMIAACPPAGGPASPGALKTVNRMLRMPAVARAWITPLIVAIPLAAAAGPDGRAWSLGPSLAVPAPSPAAVETRAIVLLAGGALRTANSIRIELPGETLALERTELWQREADDFTWIGRQPGNAHPSAILTYVGGALAGTVHGRDAVYEVASLADGRPVLMRLDGSRFPECGGGVDPGLESAHPTPASPESEILSNGDLEVDLLVLYTTAARNAAGGSAQIRATAQAAVDNANVAFGNSQMVTRFRAVGIEEWAVDEATLGTTLSQRLATLRSAAWVNARRDALAADMVGLLVENGLGSCGVGYVMRSPSLAFAPWAFQITARSCAVGNLTYAHEHGHNMGFEHDPANGTAPGNASFPWSFGHFHDRGTNAERFRTVMSYNNQCDGNNCPRRPFFSNPEVLYMGAPTGIAGARDNARSGDLVYDIVRMFRSRVKVPEVFADGFDG